MTEGRPGDQAGGTERCSGVRLAGLRVLGLDDRREPRI